MITEHKSFTWPSEETRLWRYMDVSKFLALLQTQAIWFTRLDCLGDPLEGSFTGPLRAWINENFRAGNPAHTATPDAELAKWTGFRNIVLYSMYASCWHANEHESVAMWRLYAKSDEAIALSTTFGKLAEALPSACHGGLVGYLDYDTEAFDPGNIFNSILAKRRSFSYENEVRFVDWRVDLISPEDADGPHPDAPTGFNHPIANLDFLEAVHVSPAAPEWLLGVIEQVTRQYGLAVPVNRSSLIRDPIW